jgi:eukaryotic-like serine/threonine-protein kinase
MTFTSGHKLGPYEIVAPIGAGGMGEVYRALDPRMGREVAIKVAAEQFSERFDREVRAVAALNHLNICTLHDVGPNYLVMELVEGPTLAERIEQGAIPLEDALHIARQIGDALDAAHERGIIHRDLKPANIKLKADGTVKVLDFGLAKVADAQTDARAIDSPTLTVGATQAGMILGTAAYMAPEQARGRAVDKRADIWAFGVVMFEMLIGRRLFQGEDVSETLAAVIKEDIPWNLAPARLRRLLQSCLERNPKRRLRDIGDAWRLLEDTPQVVGASKQHWLAWGAAVLFATVAVVAFWAPWRIPSTATPSMRFQIPLPEKTIGGFAALSPDGRWLVFRGTGSDGVNRLWVRAMDSLEARPLRGTEGATTPPFWSPDSRFIAFDSAGRLKKIDISGGPPQPICDFPGVTIGGSWNKDDVIVFGTLGPIMRVSAAGGVASAVTALNDSRAENRHILPVFLPDGRHFLYLKISSALENSGIYVGSLLESKTLDQDSRPLVATTFGPVYVPSTKSRGHLLFLRDQLLMSQLFDERRLELMDDAIPLAEQVGSYINAGAFSASAGVLVYRAGGVGGLNLQLTWLDAQGKVDRIVSDPGPYSNLALAPDGIRSAVARVDQQSASRDIWIVDFGRNTSTRFTFSGAANGYPIWSPDGTRVVFSSNKDGAYNLYLKLASMVKDEELLLKSSEVKTPTGWSSDGKFLLYTVADPKRKSDLWILPLEGDRKPVSLIATPFNESEGRFATDDRFIAYVSDESGHSEVYVREFRSTSVGAKLLVSKNGGTNPRWRADGKALFYSAPDGTVMRVEVNAGKTFQAGVPQPLFKLPPGATTFDMTGDGKRFFSGVPVEQGAQAPFTVVLNWQADLKK